MTRRVAQVEKVKRSASRSTVGCALSRAEPHVEGRKGVIYTKHRRQTMDEIITAYVGLDAHAESTAMAVAEAGNAAPRFIGTVGARFSELSKALGKLGQAEAPHPGRRSLRIPRART
jgi:hypothetical protein